VAGIGALGDGSLAAKLSIEELRVLEAVEELLLLIPPLIGRLIMMSSVGLKRLSISSFRRRP
jgi:hypothetical protein